MSGVSGKPNTLVASMTILPLQTSPPTAAGTLAHRTAMTTSARTPPLQRPRRLTHPRRAPRPPATERAAPVRYQNLTTPSLGHASERLIDMACSDGPNRAGAGLGAHVRVSACMWGVSCVRPAARIRQGTVVISASVRLSARCRELRRAFPRGAASRWSGSDLHGLRAGAASSSCARSDKLDTSSG